MSESFDIHRSLYLAGTIPIPSPTPNVGRISLHSLWPKGGDAASRETVLKVEHVQSNRLAISRSVLLSEVDAVHVSDDDANPPELRDQWFCGKKSVEEFAGLLEQAKPEEIVGVVYVRETARVLMNVMVSMTAAESAEYYPPVLRERSDGHYASDPTLQNATLAAGDPNGDCQC